MLDLTEKIVAVVSGLLIACTLVVYLFLGVPSTTAVAFLPAVEKAAPAPAPKNGGAGEELTAEDQALIAKLTEQGDPVLPGRKVASEVWKVPAPTFEYISAEANWLPELKKLSSEAKMVKGKPTKRKLFNLDEESVLKKLGFRENDVVSLVDGQIIEFKDDAATLYQSMFTSAVKKLRAGQAISVTVIRNNQPLNIQFKL